MFTDLDHYMANMVCPYKYKIVWLGYPTNAFIIESNSSLTQNASTAFFEYRVFHKVGRKDDDPLNYVINPQKSNETILSRIIRLDLNCFSSPSSSPNNTGEDTSILGFCNEYGLLFSRAYISYLQNTDFAFYTTGGSCKKYYLEHESMFLNDFIFNISKIRALLTAYSIYHKINQLDPSVTLTKFASILV